MNRKKGNCFTCNRVTGFSLHIRITQSSSRTYCWVCDECHSRNPGRSRMFWIPHETIRQHLSDDEIEKLPVIMPELINRCCVCGARDVQLHHWAPAALFGREQSDKWPKDYLCESCHRSWHETVTPQLIREDLK